MVKIALLIRNGNFKLATIGNFVECNTGVVFNFAEQMGYNSLTIFQLFFQLLAGMQLSININKGNLQL